MRESDELKVEEKGGEVRKNDQEEVEVDEDDSMEWELRNTDSVFSELSELSRDYVDSVDQGASIRGKPSSISFLFIFLKLILHTVCVKV